MPLFITIGIIIIACVYFSIYTAKKKTETSAKKSVVNITVFGLSLIGLTLSFTSLLSVARYVSDYGGSAIRIYGVAGAFLPLLELAVLFVLCVILGLRLFTRS